jgi:hypothetical protein
MGAHALTHAATRVRLACAELFSKYDVGNKGALSWDDIQDLVYGCMNVRCHATRCCVSTSSALTQRRTR